jgi:hypothetical protein
MTFDIENENRYNFNPSVWGPKAWFFLDSVVLSYPDNPTNLQKEHFANFFYLIGNILPCQKCGANYYDHLKLTPLTDTILKNRDNLLDWWLKIHNYVRVSTNKKSITKDNFINYYNKKYDVSESNQGMIRNIIYICIIILLIVWFKDLLFKR